MVSGDSRTSAAGGADDRAGELHQTGGRDTWTLVKLTVGRRGNQTKQEITGAFGAEAGTMTTARGMTSAEMLLDAGTLWTSPEAPAERRSSSEEKSR